jgi:predicted amidohydrolase YtcJ
LTAGAASSVPVHQARTIPEFLDLIRQRAAVTPAGEWIRTTTNWQELNLAERRMPTADELDQATDRHPVLTPGRFADLTIWDEDPAEVPTEARRDLNPTHTFVGGRLVSGPESA